MSREFTIVRGFIPEAPDKGRDGWLRIAEAAESGNYRSFNPYHRAHITVTDVHLDDVPQVYRHPYSNRTYGETRVIFEGELDLHGIAEWVEGYYYPSGRSNRLGRLTVLSAGPEIAPIDVNFSPAVLESCVDGRLTVLDHSH